MNKTIFILTMFLAFCSLTGAEPEFCDRLQQQKKKEEFQRKHPLEYRFFKTVKKNDLNGAKKCLSQGADVNGPDDNGLVPLHYAAVCQHVEMVKWLLAHGADMNKKNKWAWTPLHYALGSDEITEHLSPKGNSRKMMETVKILVEAKANVNAEDDHGITPVNLGIHDPEMLEYLVEHGGILLSGGDAYRGQTLLHWAVVYNAPVKTIELILKHGGKNNINDYDGDGYAPLHRAVRAKNLQVVKLLVEHGANINLAVEEENKTALDLAVEEKLHEIAKYLKIHGAVRNFWRTGRK